MKNSNFFRRISYRFDCLMSRGTAAMISLLFFVTMGVVIIFALLISLSGGNDGFIYRTWLTLMHVIDPGTIAGDPVDNVLYIILMFFATLFGLFVTSVLIGIIASAVEDKLNDLRMGRSVVLEKKHTFILGYNDAIFVLLRELILANQNQKDACVVVLGDCGKEEMEQAINARIPDRHNTRIICRSGSLYENHSFDLCAAENARSIIVNLPSDEDTIKALLALSSYLRGKELFCPDMHICASVEKEQYVEAARLAGEGRAEVIFSRDAIARIIASTCRQHGLSQVFTELLNFYGNEIYFESVSGVGGMSFLDCMLSFPNAIVIGYCRNGKSYLNPPADSLIAEGDKLILIEEDDGEYIFSRRSTSGICLPCVEDEEKRCVKLLILGSNDKLPMILREHNAFSPPDSEVIIVDTDFDDACLPELPNLAVKVLRVFPDRNCLLTLIKSGVSDVLLLNDDNFDGENSDSHTLLKLILLRDIADKSQLQFSITSELKSAENQRLASQARVDDFVIGSQFTAFILAQISQQRNLSEIISELLDFRGTELYMKKASNYVPCGVEVDGYTMAESVAAKGEVWLGYRRCDETCFKVELNPRKDKKAVFGENDYFVVLAQD